MNEHSFASRIKEALAYALLNCLFAFHSFQTQ